MERKKRHRGDASGEADELILVKINSCRVYEMPRGRLNPSFPRFSAGHYGRLRYLKYGDEWLAQEPGDRIGVPVDEATAKMIWELPNIETDER